jgi:murein L,D-transpeptidase YcbB/YkuD
LADKRDGTALALNVGVRLVRIRVVILLAAVVAASCGADDRRIRDRIRAEVEASRVPEYATRNQDGRKLWTSTRDFYRARAFAPVWLHKRRATLKMETLLAAIKRADRDGLDPALYDVGLVDERGGHDRTRFSDENVGEVDVRLTLAYMQLASDLADGVSDLARSHPAWHMRPQTFDAAAHLTRALADGRIAESLDALRPNNPEYRVLADLLVDYRNRSERIEQIELIELNMERWRWLPRERAGTYIVVNIPAFRLDVWERDTVVLSMRVVVGKKDTPTPIFNDAMTHIVFSPYWNVPPGIARDETLPSALRDPSFLRRTNMEVLDRSGQVVDADSIDLERGDDYRFRQRPGSGNALGHVKFMFPNEFNVYLHDTPADSLFARASRSFSHGCVRVEQPQALAEYLLKGRAEWTREAIAAAMHAGDERTVKLAAAVPVYIGYWTADVTPDGKVAFVPDVYGLDARQAAAMDQRLARARQPSRVGSSER